MANIVKIFKSRPEENLHQFGYVSQWLPKKTTPTKKETWVVYLCMVCYINIPVFFSFSFQTNFEKESNMNAIYPGESKMTPHTLVVSRNQSSSKEGKIGKIF